MICNFFKIIYICKISMEVLYEYFFNCVYFGCSFYVDGLCYHVLFGGSKTGISHQGGISVFGRSMRGIVVFPSGYFWAHPFAVSYWSCDVLGVRAFLRTHFGLLQQSQAIQQEDLIGRGHGLRVFPGPFFIKKY